MHFLWEQISGKRHVLTRTILLFFFPISRWGNSQLWILSTISTRIRLSKIQTHGQINRQRDKKTNSDRQADGQIERPADRQKQRKTIWKHVFCIDIYSVWAHFAYMFSNTWNMSCHRRHQKILSLAPKTYTQLSLSINGDNKRVAFSCGGGKIPLWRHL